MTGPLLILGASEDQLPLYREAKRRGLTVIGVDGRHDRPARRYADTYLPISIRDSRAIAAALGEIRPAAVVTGASDAGLRTWRELSMLYRTPYTPPPRLSWISADKTAFRRLADRLGLPGYRWASAARAQDLAPVPLPVVVKPNDGSGSKGLTVVEDPARLPGAFEHARVHSFDGAVIVEQRVPGRHYALELFLSGGRPLLVAVTEKRFATGFLVRSHRCPAELPAAALAAMTEAALTLCEAMGLSDGPANFDLVRTDDGRIVVVEVNGRLGGNGIPALLRAAYGADVVGALLSLVLGETVRLDTVAERQAILTMIGSPLAVQGRVLSVGGLDAARAVPGVLSAEVFAEPGDTVGPFDRSGNKIGQLLVTAGTPQEADLATSAALAALTLDVVPTFDKEPDVRA